jgi:hypothetical protein
MIAQRFSAVTNGHCNKQSPIRDERSRIACIEKTSCRPSGTYRFRSTNFPGAEALGYLLTLWAQLCLSRSTASKTAFRSQVQLGNEGKNLISPEPAGGARAYSPPVNSASSG